MQRKRQFPPPSGPWFDLAGAARYSGYAQKTIRRRIADGTLRAFIAPGSRVLRIAQSDLDRWIRSGPVPVGSPDEGEA